MDTLQATGVSTSNYKSDSILDDGNDDESGDEDDGSCDENDSLFSQDDIVSSRTDSSSDPTCLLLLFVFDGETTGFHIYRDHIMELVAQVVVPGGVSISTTATLLDDFPILLGLLKVLN